MNVFKDIYRYLQIDKKEIVTKEEQAISTASKIKITTSDRGKKMFQKVRKVNAGQGLAVEGGNFKYPEEPQEQLNLHGLYVQEAMRETHKFVDRGKVVGLRKVLIITGKGKHSDGGVARIRPVVAKILAEKLQKKIIRNFEFAEGRHGGFGAYYVYF